MSNNLFYTEAEILEKAENEDYYEISGIASTPDQDLQDEIIEQNGLDLTDLDNNKCYFIDDHGHGYATRSHARMGVIDEAKVTKKGLFIKGKIWKNHPAAAAYYNELKYKPGMVQFSVEGSVLERDAFEKGKIKRAKVSGVALTRSPVNPKTYASLVKSLTSIEDQEQTQKQEILNNKDKLFDLVKSRSEKDEEFKKQLIDLIMEKARTLGAKDIEPRKHHVILQTKNGNQKIASFHTKEDALKHIKMLKQTGEDRNLFHIEKALVPGGAQYTNPPNTITGGGVMMTESNENRLRFKKKKKKSK